MKVVVFDRRVHQNLALFRHLIHRQAEKRSRFFRKAKKTYFAFVNCNTGEMAFADLDKERKFSKDWKPLTIKLRPTDEGAFEVIGADGLFKCEELSKEAYRLFTKTMHILNQIAYDPRKGKNPFWVLRQVAHVDFILSEEEEGERNLIHRAFHNVDRVEAERLLERRAPGTYLFRKGEFAEILENELNKELSEPVVCITLTYRDWEEKVAEKTLVFDKGKWSFFNDDVELGGKSYGTVKELLSVMRKELGSPLFID